MNRKFIKNKGCILGDNFIENDIINTESIDYFFKQEWRLKDFDRFDICFKIKNNNVNWIFADEKERDRVFNKLLEEIAYEV